ncbi:MAG: single-stranded DNA-binding protein [Frankiales bacterium]|nr:MAG: single-stranded DNA-binding protein [Frankiales bacterium]
MPTEALEREPGTSGQDDRLRSRNEVVLVGRVSSEPETRELPSGDLLVSWRVVVDRPPPRRLPEGRKPPTIDTVDCVAWSAGVRRTARGLSVGDVVAVEGALRRRFWRGGTGMQSRTEVEVESMRRLRRAAAG